MQRAVRKLLSGAGLLIGTLLMSNAATAVPAPLVGEWGGFQTALKLEATGGRIQFECAAATIDQAVEPDAQGRFEVTGRLEAYAPGPDRDPDSGPNFTPVRFQGRVEGTTLRMTMHVAADTTAEELVLVRDRKAKIIRCL